MNQHAANPQVKKGDWVVNRLTGFPGLVMDGYGNRRTRLTMVWGFEHECGSQWADELVAIPKEEFEALKKRWEPEWGQFE